MNASFVRPATSGTHLGAIKYESHETTAKAKNFSLVVAIRLMDFPTGRPASFCAIRLWRGLSLQACSYVLELVG
jgi:hypothetical protein